MDELSAPFSALSLQALQGILAMEGHQTSLPEPSLPFLLMHAVVEAAADTTSIRFQVLKDASPELKVQVSDSPFESSRLYILMPL
jgi:hypothetical protein